MKRFFISFLIIISAGLILLPPENSSLTSEIIPDSTVTITIAAAGDLMCHSVQYNYARNDSGTYDFNPFFDHIRAHLSSADFTFANLETVMAGRTKGYSGYPFFNSPDEYLDAIKNAGLDLLTTANNHSLDQGEQGLRRTIEELNKRGIHYNGTFVSETDRDSIRIFDILGIKIAFLAYTYGTNGIPVPKGKSYLINLIDTIKIASDIRQARINNSDIVIVHYHFGEEYKREPDSFQREVVKQTFSAGADIIIGGHPHVIQPLDYIKTTGTSIDTGFVAYSLGNFFSNQRWRYSDAGVIVYITITKNITRDSLSLDKIEYLPTWVYKGNKTYKILPPESLNNQYDFLGKSDRIKMQQAFEDTRAILNKYSDGGRHREKIP